MTLRQRLVLTSLAVAVPLTATLFLVAERSRQSGMTASIDRLLTAQLESGLIARCEAEGGLRPPPGRGGPGGRGGPEGRGRRGGRPGGSDPVELIPYTRDFGVAFGGLPGPDFPADLKEALARDGRATGTYATGNGRGLQLAVRIDTTSGPCHILLVRMRPREGEVRDQLIALASVLVIVIAAIWIAAGPTLARIHHLATEVRASAASRYREPVRETGSDEVSALARAFNDAGRDVRTHLTHVEAREATLREFVANTTHDIAMPLTVLQSHLASLEAGAAVFGAPDDRDRVYGAIRETHYIASLLRNLATASRLEGGVPVEPRPMDLNALVERVVERHRPLARSGGVSVDFAVPDQATVIVADATLAEQAFGNLVDNAVRYNHPGGHVAVVLSRAPERRFVLTVEDDGPGVGAEELSQLATRRFRGDAARSRRPDGQGIGLTITAEAADLLGWDLAFHANAPTGLVARITGQTASTDPSRSSSPDGAARATFPP